MNNDDRTPEESNNDYKQWVAENVDHNVATVTGKGTFHGMVSFVLTLNQQEVSEIFPV